MADTDTDYYVLRTWERGTRGVDTPTRQHVIHRADNTCLRSEPGERISGTLVRHLRFEPNIVWLCERCFPDGAL